MTEASLEQNMSAARREHLVPGREIHMQDMRGYRFCEVGLITGTSQGVPQLSMLGENLWKDIVLLGAAFLTAADSLRAAHAGTRS